MLASCGGGSSSGGGNQTPDFVLTVPSSALNLQQGSANTFSVSVSALNGFTSPVSLSVAGLPSSVTANPATFSLSPGGSQTVTLTAASSATVGTLSLTITGTSGTLSHSASFSVQIVVAVTGTSRMRYLETGAHLPRDLIENPLHHLVYHASSRRFFSADYLQNSVFVYDANTEQQIGKIGVPGAFTLDQSSSGSSLYVGTKLGDIYLIDPVGLAVTQHIASSQIGPNGYPAMIVHPLSDGRFALAGNALAQGTALDIGTDYSPSFAIWNQSTNSLTAYQPANSGGNPANGQPTCSGLLTFVTFDVSLDRTKLYLLGSTGSGTGVCQFNTANGQSVVGVLPSGGGGPLLQPADGQEILTVSGGGSTSNVAIYVSSTSTMQVQDQFQFTRPASNVFYPNCTLSKDGTVLYFVSNGVVSAYNWKTHALTGWSSSPLVTIGTDGQAGTLLPDLAPQAVDETGLIAGYLGHGVGFADAKTLLSGTPEQFTAASVSPNTGSTAGGTEVQFGVLGANQFPAQIFFGGKAASAVSLSGSYATALSPASQTTGPVDVLVQLSDGGIVGSFAGFSYGPSIRQVITTNATADGGGTGSLLGYGLSTQSVAVPTDVKVAVNGQNAPVVAYGQNFKYADGASSPIESLEFTLPAGTAGATANVTVTNSNGTATASNAITYLPKTQQVPLAGAQLYQGIFDTARNVYYFTDSSKIQVFSRVSGSWLAPISMPLPSGATAQRLIGIALSPNGSKLAVADGAAGVIYVVNPSSAASVQTFPVLHGVGYADVQPCGLAITDSGIVYYSAFDPVPIVGNYSSENAFFKLDTGTGQIMAYAASVGSTDYNNSYTWVLLSSDNQHIFFQQFAGPVTNGTLTEIDTATDQVHTFASGMANAELAISANGQHLAASNALLDLSLNQSAFLASSDLQASGGAIGVHGEKLSADGSLVYVPNQNSIDVYNGADGTLITRVALPFTLSSNFDALASDGVDNVLVAITTGGSGVAVIDLSTIQKPAIRKGSPLLRERPVSSGRGQSELREVTSRRDL